MNTLEKLYSIFKESSGVCTDTRKLQNNNLFFALKGPSFNGNTYAQLALDKGAIAVVVDEKDYCINEKCILVDDVLTTLQQLASFHISTLNIPIIGVAGSNGKTTTKELIYSVLNAKYNAFCTQGNLNNHIGVPLTIFSIPKNTEIAIIELGANHIGEVEVLCEIAKPTHGIITNIGMDHLEGYGSIEGVARGNSELYHYLLKHNGVAFVNEQDDWLMRMASRLPNVVTYPSQKGTFECKAIGNGLFLKVEANGLQVDTQMTGNYNLINIAAALCIGNYFEVDTQLALDAVAAYKPSNMRSQVIQVDSNVILLDAYNANPSSMEVSIDNIASIEAENKVVILGDMFELGALSENEHNRITQYAVDAQINNIWLVGENFSKTSIDSKSITKFNTREDLCNWLSNNNKFEKTVFLLKGSRGMALEKVLPFLGVTE
ncbi:MAG: hypothetical protein RLZZ175_2884 [Bacteroidota bacterium]